MRKLTQDGRLLLSALLPSVEELADRAQEIAPDLTAAEALEVGHLAREEMAELIERALDVDEKDGNDGADAPPRDLTEVVDDLGRVCVEEAVERVRGDLAPSTEKEEG